MKKETGKKPRGLKYTDMDYTLDAIELTTDNGHVKMHAHMELVPTSGMVKLLDLVLEKLHCA